MAPGLWSFIKSTKATHSVSLKSLQNFILALTKEELVHVIECYLKSRLSKSDLFNSDGLTLKQTEAKLVHANSSPNEKSAIDNDILDKLNMHYGNKSNKKIMKKIQQNENTNLLSIHPQVLAYSFQFLSYKQFCKAQTVCIYFTYLNKQYPGLTHYYINLTQKLFSKAMRYKICLDNLSMFKHIEINAAYRTKDSWNPDAQRRANVFANILRVIINRSKSNLDILTVDLQHISHSDTTTDDLATHYNLLLHITSNFKQLIVSKLIWKCDFFKSSDEVTVNKMLQKIANEFPNTFPRLKQLSIGDHFVYPRGYTDKTAISTAFTLPIITSYCQQIESLHLGSFHGCVDNPSYFIQLIASQMINLKELSIESHLSSSIHSEQFQYKATETIFDMDTIKPSIVLRKLSIGLRPRDGNRVYVEQFLMYLFSTFIGITTFKYSFSWFGCHVQWNELFAALIHQKQTYSLHSAHSVSPLKSLTFDDVFSLTKVRDIFKQLQRLKCFALEDIKVEFGKGWTRDVHISRINNFINRGLIPLLQLYTSNDKLSKLKRLSLSLNCRTKISSVKLSFLPLVANILRCIPPSMISMELDLPHFCVGDAVGKEIKEKDGTKLVNKLCEMLYTKQTQSKLQTLSLGNLRLTAEAKKYLIFFFGYNHNIFVNGNQYCLSFDKFV